jgi:spermidine synthase
LVAWTFLLSTLVLPAAGCQADARILFQKDSFYHRIRVMDEDGVRWLHFDRTVQSAMSLEDPTALYLTYATYMGLGLVFSPNPKRVLLIGLGGGSIPKKYQREFPDMELDVAEIDPEVIRVAKNFFSFAEGKNVRVFAADGRLFLTQTPNSYDLVLLDAYHRDQVPFHLTTKEFYQETKKKLGFDGVLVCNVISAVTGPGSKILRSIVKTLNEVYPQVYVFPVRRASGFSSESPQNVIVVATERAQRLTIREIMSRANPFSKRGVLPRPIADISASYLAEPVPQHDVPVLTDDYAPTDALVR